MGTELAMNNEHLWKNCVQELWEATPLPCLYEIPLILVSSLPL